MELKKFITIKQAAALSGRSMHEIRTACKNGGIKEVIQSGSGTNAKFKMTDVAFNQWCNMQIQQFKILNGIAS
ncbi:MAG: hypothetical protein RL154_1035 [Pseudomonadota bacterium]|jgi:hypothetical protein